MASSEERKAKEKGGEGGSRRRKEGENRGCGMTGDFQGCQRRLSSQLGVMSPPLICSCMLRRESQTRVNGMKTSIVRTI